MPRRRSRSFARRSPGRGALARGIAAEAQRGEGEEAQARKTRRTRAAAEEAARLREELDDHRAVAGRAIFRNAAEAVQRIEADHEGREEEEIPMAELERLHDDVLPWSGPFERHGELV